MKYFTLFSLALLAVDAASLATDANQSKPESKFPVIFDEVLYELEHLFKKPKNLIKAQLEPPKSLTADKFVTIAPTENICVFADKAEFLKLLFAQETPEQIEKVIFCPQAIGYLVDFTAKDILKTKKRDEMTPIIAALLLRRETLINKYSPTYVKENFTNCYDALWKKLTDTSGTPYWPCNGSPCTAVDIKANFAAFTLKTPACQEILSDQLAAYSDKVADVTASSEQPVTSAVDLRKAILENLAATPHFSVALSALYGSVSENSQLIAAEKIQSELASLKAIIEKQLDNGADIYANAEARFKARLENRPVDAILKTDAPVPTTTESGPTKTIDQKQ